MKHIPYGRQEILDIDCQEVTKTLQSDFLTQGPRVEDFEKQVAEYHNAKYAVAFCNGTAALHGCYSAIGVKAGDEIISPTITFSATSNAALYCGATPKLCDISLDTYCLDVEKTKQLITKNTKVITPVSLSGIPVDLKKFKELVKETDIKIIYDAAHAIASHYEGNFGLEYADLAILSFHPVKHVTTGEGGMVLTNNKEYYDHLIKFRTHGITKIPNLLINKDEGEWYYEMQMLGYNYRLTDFQAALGISQFNRIDENLTNRNHIAKKYREELKELDLILPPQCNENSLHAYHLFILRVQNKEIRKDLYEFLKTKNIFCQIHYVPVNYLPYYQETFGYTREDFSNAKKYYETAISIPMFHSLTSEEQDYIIKSIKEFYGTKNV